MYIQPMPPMRPQSNQLNPEQNRQALILLLLKKQIMALRSVINYASTQQEKYNANVQLQAAMAEYNRTAYALQRSLMFGKRRRRKSKKRRHSRRRKKIQ